MGQVLSLVAVVDAHGGIYQLGEVHGSHVFLCRHSMRTSSSSYTVLMVKLCRIGQIGAQAIFQNTPLASRMTICNAKIQGPRLLQRSSEGRAPA